MKEKEVYLAHLCAFYAECNLTLTFQISIALFSSTAYAAFSEPIFSFIENAIRNGESVLVSGEVINKHS